MSAPPQGTSTSTSSETDAPDDAPSTPPPLDSLRAQLNPITGLPFERHFFYETTAHVLLASTDKHAIRYRVIRITKHNELLKYELESIDDSHADLVRRVDTLGRLQSAGAAWGVMGFIRFLKGYYLILVTKRCRVGRVGPHIIYEVRDTTIISLLKDNPGFGLLGRRDDESKYVELLKSMNFGNSFFYFSYTYDLTNTLQTNMVASSLKKAASPSSGERTSGDASSQPQGDTPSPTASPTAPTDPSFSSQSQSHRHPHTHIAPPVRSQFLWNEYILETLKTSFPQRGKDVVSFLGTEEIVESLNHLSGSGGSVSDSMDASRVFPCSAMTSTYALSGFRMEDPLLALALHVIHGYVVHSRIQSPSNQITVTLIARKSKYYAGSRYLKRGIIDSGSVANHVEVEQIVVDSGSLSDCLTKGKFSSYVQVRGSVPVHWYHPPTRRPQPPVRLSLIDPTYSATKRHFAQLVHDFGAPVFVINLLKRSENKRRERILIEEYEKAIATLNAHQHDDDETAEEEEMKSPNAAVASAKKLTSNFATKLVAGATSAAPTKEKLDFLTAGEELQLEGCEQGESTVVIHYRSFDLRNNTLQAWNTITSLAESSMDEIGFFVTDNGAVQQLQSGIVRTNCVDCIDRTNFGKTVVGLHVLEHQLAAVGLLEKHTDISDFPQIQSHFFKMYLEVGDAIALQYGGSATVGVGGLVYRGRSWDRLMELQRLYNNVWSDGEKQQAYNLFLGLYRPCPLTPPAPDEYFIPKYEAPRGALSGMFSGSSHTDRRRVIDIDELEGDMELHLRTVPTLNSTTGGNGPLWWKKPLAEYAQRFQLLDERTHEIIGRLRSESKGNVTSQRSLASMSDSCGTSTPAENSPAVKSPADTSPSQSMQQPLPRASPTSAETVVDSNNSVTGGAPSSGKESSGPPASTGAVGEGGNSIYNTLAARHKLIGPLISLVDSDEETEDGSVRSMKRVIIHREQRPHFATTPTGGGGPSIPSLAAGVRSSGHSTLSPIPTPRSSALDEPSLSSRSGGRTRTHSASPIYQSSPSTPGGSQQNILDDFMRFRESHPCTTVYGRQAPLQYADDVGLDEHLAATYPMGYQYGLKGIEQEFRPETYSAQLAATKYTADRRSMAEKGVNFDPGTTDMPLFLSCLSVLGPISQWGRSELTRALDYCAASELVKEAVLHSRMNPVALYSLSHTGGINVFQRNWVHVKPFIAILREHERSRKAGLKSDDTALLKWLHGEEIELDHPAKETPGNMQEILVDLRRHYVGEATTDNVKEIATHWLNLMTHPTQGLPARDRIRYIEGENQSGLNTSVPTCQVLRSAFNGAQFIGWAVAHATELGLKLQFLSNVMDQAIQARSFLSLLIGGGLVHHLTSPSSLKGLVDPQHPPIAANNEHALYRLFRSDERLVLNTSLPTGRCDLMHQPAILAESLANIAIQFFEEEMEEKISKKAALEQLAVHSQLLQGVDLCLMTDTDAQIAFFVNVFNALHIQTWFHAHTQPAMDYNIADRCYMYNIGGFYLSLADIKHGILRGNLNPPRALLPRFLKGDPRKSLIINYDQKHLDHDIRRKVLLALMDIYLTPQGALESDSHYDHLDVVTPVGAPGGSFWRVPSTVVTSGGGSGNPQPNAEDDDEGDEVDEDELAPGQTEIRVAPPKPASLLQWLLGGRKASKEPYHLCVVLTPALLQDRLTALYNDFLAPLQRSQKEVTPVEHIVMQRFASLAGLPEFGRTKDEVVRNFTARTTPSTRTGMLGNAAGVLEPSASSGTRRRRQVSGGGNSFRERTAAAGLAGAYSQ